MNTIFSNYMKALAILCLLIGLTGCWNSRELTELGFLMGVSLDQAEDGKIELTTQIYSPAETIGGAAAAGDKSPYTNIKTVNGSIFDAAREVTLYLGRQAQWSHMRTILIGEQFAKENDILEVLDFFYRDHEPRFSMHVLITDGKAADYLQQKPFIERTMSQQLRTMIESGSKLSGNTKEALLLDIALQLNSKVKTAMIPYIKTADEPQKSPYASGVAIINKGKMVDRLTSDEVQKILMLTNEYKLGVIEYPCMDEENEKKGKKETLDSSSIKTKVSPDFTQNPPTVKMLTKVKGKTGNLQCSSFTTEEELKKLEDHVEKILKEEIKALIEHSQEKKVDVLGIGNKIYKKDPALWKKWEKDWDNIYADIQFVNDVEVSIESSGMSHGKKVKED